ncbi:Chromatin modification-related protein YNG2, partial [Zootermopsis nevadensis]
QYLGLQPTVKFKCYKCGESGFPSMLKLQEHQNTCLKNCNKIQTLIKSAPPPTTSESTPSTNFRITRKVYLCSACGTYYENWNLFLHMREVHKRHTCLFCLGMFSQADKLATHLSGKHGVIEGLYASSEHFISEFKGSCFLMCCTCERIFTEQENFFDHSCSEGLVINTDKACFLCGLRGAHFPTCRRAFTNSSSSPPPPPPPSSSSSVPSTLERPPESTQNSQPTIQENSRSVTKYLIPLGKVPGKKSNQKPNTMLDNTGESQEKSRDLSDIDDDYDISNAAAFCHVNIHEPSEKQKPVAASKVKTCKSKSQEVVTKKISDQEPTSLSPTTNINQNCTETSDDKRYEDVQDNSINIKEKEIQESDECYDNQSSKISSESEESVHKGEIEADKSAFESMTDFQNSHKLESPAMEKLQPSVESDTKSQLQLQRETNSKFSPKYDVNPKKLSQTETKISLTPCATEVDSESESSESDDDTEDSSTSSEASSEESDHYEGTKDKEKSESDADNADSDKMSLVVDENRSEEEEKTELQKEVINDVEKHAIEDKMSEVEDSKQDEPKSDTEEVQNTAEETQECVVLEHEKTDEPAESVQLAGDEVPLLELTLEESLDTMNIQMLLKESVKVSCLNCVYCNHAKKIAVNGKQLALHLLAEHRFAPVVCSDSGELTEADGFVDRLKTSLSELQQMFFNTDSYDNMDQTCVRPHDRTYECFHCHFLTNLHKELYVHNRKMHQKTILLCIMCKSNFYSYSELLCHLCPGIYVPESNISFRCCLCTVDGLPSAFRLMVHLRKRHHACDVCLETTEDQQKLSNHVWKHKLHHLCYRCGIAYRNKPDITKHLFWKHGTESVLCKKCLQKKWPHVYHFCIPPNSFVCEECNSSFSRAVALKVHKRLHAGDLPYPCSECEERFISRKLLTKHQEKHREPSSPKNTVETKLQENGSTGETENQEDKTKTEKVPVAENLGEGAKYEEKDVGEKKSKVVDVYDLPPLNLSSESDDSDDDGERKETQLNVKTNTSEIDTKSVAINESTNLNGAERISETLSQTDEDVQQPVEVVDGIWDNFKTYKANLERRENQHTEIGESSMQNTEKELQFQLHERSAAEIISVIYMDHDYCGPPAGTSHSVDIEEQLQDMLVSEAAVPVQATTSPTKKKQKSPKKKRKRSASSSSSDSSSNSDSSTCSCGTNCSCSSSSSSSSGSSSSQSSDSDSSGSEGRQRQAARRECRSERAKKRKLEEVENATPAKAGATEIAANGPPEQDEVPSLTTLVEPEDMELPVRESDLDTDETETDEDFYDKHPQRLANKLLAEKRNQLLLLAAVAPVNNGTMSQSGQSPPASSIEEPVPKKKVKIKKHKKSQHQHSSENKIESKLKLNIPTDYYSTQSPIFSKSTLPTSASNSMNTTTLATHARPIQNPFLVSHPEPLTPTTAYHSTGSGSETDSKRLSKRKRVPKKFYGDSSDDEPDHPPVKWRKVMPAVSNSPVPVVQPSAGCSSAVSAPERIQFPTINEDKSEEEAVEDSDSDREDTKKSNSESSNSESEAEKEQEDDEDEEDDDDGDDDDDDDDLSDADSEVKSSSAVQTNSVSAAREGDAVQQKNENLYCYCQCPYDEVSEMIACDGKDCTIEWFHFECVGIMVPPKGKWFCPDCRKR